MNFRNLNMKSGGKTKIFTTFITVRSFTKSMVKVKISETKKYVVKEYFSCPILTNIGLCQQNSPQCKI
jgi:hypothetical protein